MQTKFEQLLDYLINEETDKANELFHEIVVEKSRTIYENLIAEEEKDEDEKAKEDEKADESVEENFGGESVIEIGGDATDDLMSDVEFGDDEGGEDDMGGDDMGGLDALDGDDDMAGAGDVDDRVQDLEDALDELKAEFEALIGDVDTDSDGDHDMADHDGEDAGEEEGEDDGEEEEQDESFIREYTEKVAAGHGAEKKGAGEKNVNAKSPLAGENRMGGTAFKLGQGDEKGGVKGGLLNPSAKEDNAGNVNQPGGTSAKQFFSKDGKGHGAEKKGSGESAGNTKSPLAPSHAK
jgi:hypothetical protein